MKIKKSIRILSCILSVLMLIVSMPMYAFATLVEDSAEETVTDAEEGTANVVVLEEDESKREENVKHFKLSDGTTKAVVYAEAVHYLDENGRWVDINNALTLNGSSYETSNKSEIKLANKSGSSKLVSIKDGGYKIDFNPLNASKVSVEIENPQGNNSRKFEDVSVLNNIMSRATYRGIYDGIDIEYLIIGNSIKENIIVNEAQNEYTYSFELKLNNLTATLENGAIILSDSETGEAKYEIATPYMYDASGAYSKDVEYTLTQSGTGKYLLTVTADSEWVNDEERAFPVTIDPSIGIAYDSIDTNNLAIEITATSSGVASINSLPTIPNDAYLTGATVSLKTLNDIIENECYIGVYQYNTSTPVDYQYLDYTVNPDGWYTWNVKDIVSNWYNDTSVTRKLEFKLIEGSGEIAFQGRTSVSRPMFEVSYRDMKGIESYWSYITQSAGSAGTGAVNLATGNLVFEIGTLTTTDSIFSITPSLIYNSALAGQEYKYGNANIGNTQTYTANGFKLNLNETIIKKSFLNESGVSESYYIWVDSDGTEHAFYETSTNVYEDEDGLQMRLETGFVSSNGYEYVKLRDSEHNLRLLHRLQVTNSDTEEQWYLSYLFDKNSNRMRVAHYGGPYRTNYLSLMPANTSDVSTELLHFQYNSDTRLSLVMNQSSREAILFRHSATPTGTSTISGGVYLREALYITYDSGITSTQLLSFLTDTDNVADGITVNAVMEYEYDSNGYLISANDTLSGHKIEYIYTNGKITRINEYGQNNTLGQSAGISYYSGYTEVRYSGTDDVYGNDDDLINVYVFDDSGRASTTYTTNVDRTVIYGASSGQYGTEETNSQNSLVSAVTSGAVSANYLINGSFEAFTPSSYWTLSNASVRSITQSENQTNTKRIKLDLSTATEAYISQYAYLSAGKYTLSLMAYSADSADINLKMSVGSNEEIIPISEERGTLENYLATFTFEITEETAQPYLVKISASAEATTTANIFVDDIMLSKTSATAEYNFVTHGEFEDTCAKSNGTYSSTANANEGGYWYFWSSSGYGPVNKTTVPCTIIEDANFGNALKITGDIKSQRSAHQTLISNNTFPSYCAPLTFKISGYGKATSIINNPSSAFGIKVTYVFEYDNTSYRMEAMLPFATNTTSWQYVTGSIVIPKNAQLSVLEISCEYSRNAGVAYFDNISVVMSNDGTVSQMEYYETGKLKYARQGVSEEFYHYDNNGNLIDYFNNLQRINYTYDSRYRVTEETVYSFSSDLSLKDYTAIMDNATSSTLYSRTNYTYNDYGMLTQQRVSGASVSPIVNSYEYDTALTSKTFGAIIKSTDTLGNITRYFYNSQSGRLLAIVEPNNKGYAYTYDVEGRLTLVQPVTYSNSSYTVITSGAEIEYVYNENGYLSSIIANGTEYTVSYDVFGNQESVSIGDTQIVATSYNERNGKVSSQTYASGTVATYEYDELSRVSSITYTKGTSEIVYTYEYDSNNNLCKHTNSQTGMSTLYEYNLYGGLIGETVYDTETGIIKNANTYTYDDQNRLSQVSHIMDYQISTGTTAVYDSMYYDYVYRYDGLGRVSRTSVTFLNAGETYFSQNTYDVLNRLTKRSTTLNRYPLTNDKIYSFVNGEGTTSSLVSQYVSALEYQGGSHIEASYKYTYDSMGNITAIIDAVSNAVIYTYTYDSYGRLIREDNSPLNETCTYTYDSNGNILTESIYSYTTGELTSIEPSYTVNYAYANTEWQDRLTSYDGRAITYDAMGNPRSYRGINLNWDALGNLSMFSATGILAQYRYNDEGIRTTKIVKGVVHEYTLEGTRILYEAYGDKLIAYFYDETGSPIGMAIRTRTSATTTLSASQFTYYLFTKNLQGDIVGIYTPDGAKVAEYRYDAWGNHTVYNGNGAVISSAATSFIGNINPFRYRGYYFDTESGFYYLNSRYYDPQVKRFISADDISYLGANGDLNSFNLYAYCSNNPVMYVDPTGNFPILALVLGITALVGLGLTIGGVASDNNTLTAVGLTMVAIPALISGVGAIAAGVGGATLTGIVGGVTTLTGVGTGLFASAEYQEAFTGSNWMLDAGMSEGWYNGLMLSTATIATAGTFASSFMSAFNIKSINKIGKLTPSNHPNEGYFGIRFKNNRGALRSIEFQNHAPHGVHLQLNSWNPKHMSVSTIRRWKWFLTKM